MPLNLSDEDIETMLIEGTESLCRDEVLPVLPTRIMELKFGFR
jgi:hypothetical protein